MSSSWGFYNILKNLICRQRFLTGNGSPEQNLASSWTTMLGDRAYFLRNQGLKLMVANDQSLGKPETNIERNAKVGPSPAGPSGPPNTNFPLCGYTLKWAKWVVGSLLALFFPFLKQKLAQLKLIEAEAEIVVQGAEKVAEVVEEVATTAEKVSADVVENHPEDSKLKEAALLVERISKATAHEAQVTKEFFHKVDELKHDFEDLENMVEPVIEKIVNKKADES